jgi:hypothetical protein
MKRIIKTFLARGAYTSAFADVGQCFGVGQKMRAVGIGAMYRSTDVIEATWAVQIVRHHHLQ